MIKEKEMNWGRIILSLIAIGLCLLAFALALWIHIHLERSTAAEQKRIAGICILSFMGCIILLAILFLTA